MKTAILVQSRLASTRLPNKALEKLGNSTLIQQIMRRCAAARAVDAVALCCPTKDVEPFFAHTGIMAYGGPEKDILTRLLDTAKTLKVDRFVRVTGDNPFVCPRMIEAMIFHQSWCKKPVVTNVIGHTFPDGLDLEVYDVAWLEKLRLPDEDDREWFAQWIAQNRSKSSVERIVNPVDLGKKYRLTVDFPEDLELARAIYDAMGGDIWESKTILSFMDANPRLKKINAHRIDGKFGARPK